MTSISNPLQNSFQTTTGPQGTTGTATSTDSGFDAEARARAEEFEASFLTALLTPVFDGLAKDATFGGGFGEEAFTGLLTQEYAREISAGSDLGVADAVYRQLITLQESAEQSLTPNSLNASSQSNPNKE